MGDGFDSRRAFIPDDDTFRVIHQDEVGILTPEAPYKYMLMGPLKPCQGIVIERGGYVLVYHRSSFSSLDYLPIIYDHMVKKYSLHEAPPPKVTIYSAALDAERFVSMFAKAYARHHGSLLSQGELMAVVQQLVAKSLQISAESIQVIINPSMAVVGLHYVAESILVDKRGNIAMAPIDDIKCKEATERDRTHSCMRAIFGGLDSTKHRYPPYMREDEAPVGEEFNFQTLGKKPRWPSYRLACKHCESITTDQIDWLVASSSPQTGMKKCSGCHQAHYCRAECQKADWPKHKAKCRVLSQK